MLFAIILRKRIKSLVENWPIYRMQSFCGKSRITRASKQFRISIIITKKTSLKGCIEASPSESDTTNEQNVFES